MLLCHFLSVPQVGLCSVAVTVPFHIILFHLWRRIRIAFVIVLEILKNSEVNCFCIVLLHFMTFSLHSRKSKASGNDVVK